MEKNIIVCMLKNIEIFFDKITQLRPSDFKTPVFKLIATEIVEYFKTYQNQISIDNLKISLAGKISASDYKEIDSFLTLVRDSQKTYAMSDANFFFDEMRKRNLAEDISKYLSGIGRINTENVNTVIENFRSKIFEYEDKRVLDTSFTGFKVAPNIINRFVELEKTTKRIKIGLTDMDRITGGFQPGELITIAAASGHGKSVILQNFTYNAFDSGLNVLYLSLELSEKEVLSRFLSMISKIDYAKIRNFKMSNTEWTKMMLASIKTFIDPEDVPKFKQILENNPSIGKKELFEKCAVLRKRTNHLHFNFLVDTTVTISTLLMHITNTLTKHKIDLIVIDHLNEIWVEGVDYWLGLGLAASTLKRYALKKNIPIIIAAQLALPKKDEERNYNLLRYSKMVVERSDYVIGAFRSEEDRLLNRLKLIFLKHRSSPGAEFIVSDNFNVMRIGDYDIGGSGI